MKFTFLEETLEEYDAALDYYISRSEVAARAFAAEFEVSVGAITENPLRWRKEGESARIYRMPNFPTRSAIDRRMTKSSFSLSLVTAAAARAIVEVDRKSLHSNMMSLRSRLVRNPCVQTERAPDSG